VEKYFTIHSSEKNRMRSKSGLVFSLRVVRVSVVMTALEKLAIWAEILRVSMAFAGTNQWCM